MYEISHLADCIYNLLQNEEYLHKSKQSDTIKIYSQKMNLQRKLNDYISRRLTHGFKGT